MKNLVIRMVLTLAIIFSMTGFIVNSISAASSLSGWANRVQLTIDHTKISGTLTNFPVMVHLSTASGISKTNVSGIFNTLGNNSQKIAVTTADGTQLYTEIKQWDAASQQAYLFVKVPSLSSSTDTVLYLYYDNSQADNAAYVGTVGSTASQNVWDSNYMAVYHLDEQGTGTSGEIKDSTSHQHNGTAISDTGKALPVAVSTKIGLAEAFNGGANNNYNDKNYIKVPDSKDLSIENGTTRQMTFSVWYNPNVTLNWQDTSAGVYVHTIGKGNVSGQWEWDMGLGVNTPGSEKYLGIMNYEFNPPGAQGDGVGLGPYYTAPSSHPEWNQKYSIGAWLYIVGSYDNAGKSMSLTVYYCDGSQNLKVKATRTNNGWSYLSSPAHESGPLFLVHNQGAFSEIVR